MTNRERLQRIMRDLEKIQSNKAITPAPFGLLDRAMTSCEEAGRYPLDVNERAAIGAEPYTP